MADIGYGAQLWVGASTGATTATVQFAALTGVTPPGLSVDEVETTNTDQTDYVRRFGPGLIDPGSVSIEGDYIPSSDTDDLIRTMIAGRQTRYMEIRFTKLSPVVKIGGRGFYTEFTPGTPMDGKMTFTATIRPAEGLWAEVA